MVFGANGPHTREERKEKKEKRARKRSFLRRWLATAYDSQLRHPEPERAFLKLQLWRTSAERGNRSAAELAERLFEVTVAHEDEDEEERALSTSLWQHPVETNQLFLSLPQTARGDAVVAALAGGAPPSPLSAASSCRFYHA